MDFRELRSEFPILEEMAYLDIAYGNPLPSSVRDAMAEFLDLQQRRGVSVARSTAFGVIETLRVKFGHMMGVEPCEVALIKNTSEGLNLAASGIDFRTGDNVVLTGLEHPNNIYCWLRLRRRGVEVRVAPQRDGRVDIGEIEERVDGDTKAVAISSTTNLGFRFDLERIGEICREESSYLVVDAIQSLGIEPMDVKRLGVDMVSSSAHKGLLGPHGIGFFYCRGEIIEEMEPMSVAGSCYEKSDDPWEAELKPTAERFEGGNYNYAGVYGASAGLDLLLGLHMAKVARHCLSLSNGFREGLEVLGARVHDSPVEGERSHIVTFSHSCVSCVELCKRLEEKGVRVSSHYGILRASFAPFNDESDVEASLRAIGEILG